MLKTTWVLLALTLALGGCMSSPIKDFNVAKANEVLDNWSCAGLDAARAEACRAAYRTYADPARDETTRRARLLRAHGLLVLFTRYAAARFPDYSEDLVNDATKAVGRVEATRAVFRTLTDVSVKKDPRGALYPVDRVDAFLALIDVAQTATSPTRRGLFRLVVASSPIDRIERGAEILENALRDLLYLDAYRESLENLRLGVKDDGTLAAAIAELDKQLAQFCGQLGRMAELPNRTCLPPKQ